VHYAFHLPRVPLHLSPRDFRIVPRAHPSPSVPLAELDEPAGTLGADEVVSCRVALADAAVVDVGRKSAGSRRRPLLTAGLPDIRLGHIV
jgi:hypothetical protein